MKIGPFEVRRSVPAMLSTADPADTLKRLDPATAAQHRARLLEAQSWENHNTEMFWRREQRWASLTDPQQAGQVSDELRQRMVTESRKRSVADPLYRRAVTVTTDFCLGRGTSAPKLAADFRKRLLGEGGDEKMAEALGVMVRRFWLNDWNRLALTAAPVQARRFSDWQIEGELCSVLQRRGNDWIVTILDPLRITAVEADPDVPGVPMLWRSDYYQNGRPHRQWYWSQNAEIDPTTKQALTDKHAQEWSIDADAAPKDDEWLLVFPVGFSAAAMRGTPPYWSVIPWSDSVNDLASMLRSYVFALTQWVWQKKVKATAADIARQQAAMGGLIDGTNPVPTRAAVRISGQGEDLEPVNITSQGGALFEHGFEVCRLMVCAGTGLPVTYLMGDPSTGNLATAESMELPVLKRFEHWQMLWVGVFDELFRFQARQSGIALDTESLIELDLPDLDMRDAKGLLPALAQGVMAGFLPAEDAAKVAAWALDAGSAEEMVERVKSAAFSPAGATLSQLMESQPARALALFQQVYEQMRTKVVK